MNRIIGELKQGERFTYANIEWIKLDDDFGGSLVLAVNTLFNSVFDENESNNWAKSSLRKSLNSYVNGNFTNSFLRAINKDDLIEFERDLTTDDGMTEYGACKDFISLYTCNEYRKYRKIIPYLDTWHWTITGDSLFYSHYVRYVHSDGCLNDLYAYCGNLGVRPLCVLKSEMEVE